MDKNKPTNFTVLPSKGLPTSDTQQGPEQHINYTMSCTVLFSVPAVDIRSHGVHVAAPANSMALLNE